jgi:hypothetical protein
VEIHTYPASTPIFCTELNFDALPVSSIHGEPPRLNPAVLDRLNQVNAAIE